MSYPRELHSGYNDVISAYLRDNPQHIGRMYKDPTVLMHGDMTAAEYDAWKLQTPEQDSGQDIYDRGLVVCACCECAFKPRFTGDTLCVVCAEKTEIAICAVCHTEQVCYQSGRNWYCADAVCCSERRIGA
jgi:hypothetical protein